MHGYDPDVRDGRCRRFPNVFPAIPSQYGSGAQCHYENGGAIIPNEEEKFLCRLPDKGRVAFGPHLFYVVGERQ